MLQQALFARHAQVVDEREMLRVFVQADASAMRDDRDVESASIWVRTVRINHPRFHQQGPSVCCGLTSSP